MPGTVLVTEDNYALETHSLSSWRLEIVRGVLEKRFVKSVPRQEIQVLSLDL